MPEPETELQERAMRALAEAGAGGIGSEYARSYAVERYAEGLAEQRRLVREIGFTGRKRALDIGSGAGHWSIALALENERVEGVEPDADFLAVARHAVGAVGLEGRIGFHEGVAESLPFEDGAFELAWCDGVLMFTDPEAAIAEAARVLRAEGLFYCGYATPGFRLLGIYDRLRRPQWAFVESQIRNLMGDGHRRHGLYHNPWSRIRTFATDEPAELARLQGFSIADRPGIQPGIQSFIGLPTLLDFVARREPEEAEGGQDEDVLARAEELVAAGAPRSALRLVAAAGLSATGDDAVRRLVLRALLRAGRGSGDEARELEVGESDPLLLALLAHERREFLRALELYRAAGEERAPRFLVGSALLAEGRNAEAKREFEASLAAGEDVLSAYAGLMAVPAAARDVAGVTRVFAALMDELARSTGAEAERDEAMAMLERSGSFAARMPARSPDPESARLDEAVAAVLAAEIPPTPGVEPAQFDYALDYTRKMFRRGLAEYRSKLQEIGFAGLERGLDIGSGPGHWSVAFALDNREVDGIEVRADFVDLAQRVAAGLDLADRVRFAVGRAEELEFEDETFDAAWAHSVLMFTEAETALSEAARVLRPGGLFYCGYSTLGFRLDGIHKGLVGGRWRVARAQIWNLMGDGHYRHGLYNSAWSRTRTFTADELEEIGGFFGLSVESRPGVQEGIKAFLGVPGTFDFVLRRQEATTPDGGDALAAAERLVRVGAPLAALRLLESADLAPDEQRTRGVTLRALVKAGKANGADARRLEAEESDPLLLALLAHDRRDYPRALELYAEAGEDRAPRFLVGAAHLARGDRASAEREFDAAIAAGEGVVHSYAGLLAAYAADEDVAGVTETFSALVETLGAAEGQEAESARILGELAASVSG
jgi:ubiquinone/menaquinone biosynthesis C-methylase UbiE